MTELAAPFAVSLPAVSKHLRVLENAGLLAREKSGRIQKCRLKAGPMQSATHWLARYQHHWENPAEALAKRSRPRAAKAEAPRSRPSQQLTKIFLLTKIPPSFIFNRSVKFDASTLDTTFSALADPTRRAMLACLAFAESSVTELAAPFNISLPAFSKHLRVLQQAGLISREKHGRINLCRLVATPMQEAAAWIDRYRLFWEKQLDALAAYLEK